MSEWVRFGTSKIFIVSKVCEIVVPKSDLKQKKILIAYFFKQTASFSIFLKTPLSILLKISENIRLTQTM